MSWNGTVRCSACYGKGHNKSSCPERKTRYEQAKKDNPGSWFVAQYEEEQERRKIRACSYCREPGHTRRTCSHLKSDRATAITRNQEWRTQVLDFFKNLGLGIGSLVEVRHTSQWGGADNVARGVVSTINWNAMTFHVKHKGMRGALWIRPLKNFGNAEHVPFPNDPAGIVRESGEYGTHITVLGRISSQAVEACVPDAWADEHGDFIDSMFEDNWGKRLERANIWWVEQ